MDKAPSEAINLQTHLGYCSDVQAALSKTPYEIFIRGEITFEGPVPYGHPSRHQVSTIDEAMEIRLDHRLDIFAHPRSPGLGRFDVRGSAADRRNGRYGDDDHFFHYSFYQSLLRFHKQPYLKADAADQKRTTAWLL